MSIQESFLLLRGLARKWFLQRFDSSLRISVISALNISRYYSYAEITEIRRDRREDFQFLQRLLFVQSPFKAKSSGIRWSVPENRNLIIEFVWEDDHE